MLDCVAVLRLNFIPQFFIFLQYFLVLFQLYILPFICFQFNLIYSIKDRYRYYGYLVFQLQGQPLRFWIQGITVVTIQYMCSALYFQYILLWVIVEHHITYTELWQCIQSQILFSVVS